MALHLNSHMWDSSAEVRFLSGTCSLELPVFHYLERFLLDVEWPFNDFSFLTFTCILSLQVSDKCSSLLSIFTICFAMNLIFLSDVESCRGLERPRHTCAAPNHTFSLRNSQAFNWRL